MKKSQVINKELPIELDVLKDKISDKDLWKYV